MPYCSTDSIKFMKPIWAISFKNVKMCVSSAATLLTLATMVCRSSCVRTRAEPIRKKVF